MTKRIFYLVMINALLALGSFPLRAQTTGGTEFWLTFGKNAVAEDEYGGKKDLQIRIVSGNLPTTGTIYFTNLDAIVPFNIAARQVYTYNLSDDEKNAVYNTTMGVSDRSVHITTDNSVTVYALNQAQVSTDATNVLPVNVLGNDHYQISYIAISQWYDAYAIIAIQENTNVYHNGEFIMTLNIGEVYYRTSSTDMTGAHITSNKPVAFFAVNQGPRIPPSATAVDCLFQQLAPINTWGKTFFVPVSHLTKDKVRVVASEDGTTILQTGGTLITNTGGQSNYTINAGEFIELDVTLDNNGCYIISDKPIGVCTYLTGQNYHHFGGSDPAQSWLPAIEQTVTEALIAPFVPTGVTALKTHYALIIVSTTTKNDTKVSIGGAPPEDLSGGTWRNNDDAGMSFYTMPLTNASESYYFTNNDGLIIWCYGIGSYESYYYLGYSSMRNLSAGFYANDIPNQDMKNHPFCENEIDFRAKIEAMGVEVKGLKWYIDNVEYLPAQNKEEWSTTFDIGHYLIKLEVYPDEGDVKILEGDLYIGVHISATASPPDGGFVEGDGCLKVGEKAELRATPNEGYVFSRWAENNETVSKENPYIFEPTQDRNLIAHFTVILEFDSVAVTKWCNTFMLNLKKLREEEGIEVDACIWYKNGDSIHNGKTYSVGDAIYNRFSVGDIWRFELITKNGDIYCSTDKIIDCHEDDKPVLRAYPNPLSQGSRLTIEGAAQGALVEVYDLSGTCVSRTTATGTVTELTLTVRAGVYVVRSNNEQVKVIIK